MIPALNKLPKKGNPSVFSNEEKNEEDNDEESPFDEDPIPVKTLVPLEYQSIQSIDYEEL
eukprot:CAMPEP_0170551796 /NCGR_PEP_ID=MMETSP0211-20121228/9800_1 /TAXON_ID=311385 /ORGANISM="Pseudokeronopsis sp., Strain OXSARD2" /LENGTH=59 /DNA_ID=CAMNT_0010859195 /DNA_START=30 /DNA_END=209 /DNA_ORIENTATION=+